MHSPVEPKPEGPAVSPLARHLGRTTLRMMRWPGRRWIGSVARKRSRLRGGQRFKVSGADGVTLDAWHSPAEPVTEPKLPVVICHGWMEVKELHFAMADRLNRRGHDVILYDHRGHGHSTGRAVTFGVKERLDLQHVIDQAGQRGLIGPRVATLGFSLGAATVIQHAPDDPRVAGIVALAPFTDFRTAIGSFRDLLTPWMNMDWLMRGFEAASREAGFEIDASSTVEAIARIRVPIMIVEGGRDRTLPPDAHVRPLTEACAGRDTLRVFTVADARHASLVHRRWPGLDEAVDGFLDELCQPSELVGVAASTSASVLPSSD
jgi:alpha-beta hydrolase superfamily lysophospholipase